MKKKLIIAIIALFMFTTFGACEKEGVVTQSDNSLEEVKEANNEETVKDSGEQEPTGEPQPTEELEPTAEPTVTGAPNIAPNSEDMDSDVISEPILMPVPPLSYYISDNTIVEEPHSIQLNMKSSEPNDIIDDEEWFIDNDLSMNTFEVPDPLGYTDGNLPDEISKKWNDLVITKAFYDDSYIYCTYGNEFGEGYILDIYDVDSFKIEYSLDFTNYYYKSEYTEADYGSMYHKIEWATIKDNILYFAHGYNTYARETEYLNAYITAVDLADWSILWSTDALVCNSYNFLIIDDVIISGYGFTEEPDFLYQVSINTGKVIDTIPLKTAPSYFIKKDNILFVRTYDTNYEFEMIQ